MIFTFGYGDEPDPEYLREISDEANGVYYHINSPDSIPLAFTDCLGGLLSVVAQNLTLTVEAAKGTTLVDVQTNFKKTVVTPGSCIKVAIDDIYSEEQKDILCVIKVPKLNAPADKYSLADFSLTYNDLLSRQSGFQHMEGTVNRSQQLLAPLPVNPAVDKQKNRMICTNALQEALNAGQQSKFFHANSVLQVAQKAIMTSPTANDQYCQILVQQLQEGQSDVATQENFRLNQNRLNTNTTSHAQQRSTHSTPMYSTTSKRSMKSSYINTQDQ